MTLLRRLGGLELVVVTGKGGVGKSTVAAALGRILARTGRRVLLLEIDPRENLYQSLGVEPSGGRIVRVDRALHVQNLAPRAVIDQLVREQLRIDLLAERVLASPVYRHFTDGAPGLKELAALGHALRVVRGSAGRDVPEIDVVVLDAPATGHGVSLLAAPGLVSEVIRDGPFGRMGADLAAFVADPDRCGLLLVTLAEEMPVQEAIELIAMVRTRLGREPELLAVNGLFPPGAPGAAGDGDRLLDLWLERRRVNDRELRRLREAWAGPRIDLPMLPLERGPALTDAIAVGLEGGLSEVAWAS